MAQTKLEFTENELQRHTLYNIVSVNTNDNLKVERGYLLDLAKRYVDKNERRRVFIISDNFTELSKKSIETVSFKSVGKVSFGSIKLVDLGATGIENLPKTLSNIYNSLVIINCNIVDFDSIKDILSKNETNDMLFLRNMMFFMPTEKALIEERQVETRFYFEIFENHNINFIDAGYISSLQDSFGQESYLVFLFAQYVANQRKGVNIIIDLNEVKILEMQRKYYYKIINDFEKLLDMKDFDKDAFANKYIQLT